MPQKVYAHAKSKAELNRRLNKGEQIEVTEYNFFNPDGYITRHILNTLDQECIVAIFSTCIQDNANGNTVPQPKVWGTYMPLRRVVL